MRQKEKDRLKILLCTTFDLCDNNGYISTQIHNFFVQNGHEMVKNPACADYIVISTCGFDQDREHQSYAIVSDYVDQNAHKARIIVCGCLASINPELFDTSKVTIIGAKELNKFNQIFQPKIKIENISGGALNEHFINKAYGFLDAYYLQICQGCINNCSYCAIKKAKGYVKSKPLKGLVAELENAIRAGYKRVMLLGDDCGSYGVDLGTNLVELLNELNNYNIGININYIHPSRLEEIYPRLSMGTLERLGFMNVPIQSTSPRILDLMNRHYDAEKIFEVVEDIKSKFPHLFLETHIIYGFPSETREEFEDTFRAIDFFDSVIYFYYTNRKNVDASKYKGKITTSEVICRTKNILNHPNFCIQRDNALLPVILLGYDIKTADDIFKSIESSLP